MKSFVCGRVLRKGWGSRLKNFFFFKWETKLTSNKQKRSSRKEVKDYDKGSEEILCEIGI